MPRRIFLSNGLLLKQANKVRVGESVVHILRVAGINYGNSVALYGVGVISLMGVCHVIACPSADGRTAAWQRFLDGIDGEESIAHVPLHILV